MKKSEQGNELKIYGINAAHKLFLTRPESIIRAYLLKSMEAEFRALLIFLKQRKLAYHIVNADELANISGALHHEGICLLIKEKNVFSERELFTMLNPASLRNFPTLIYLDGVVNPLNVGALMRSAAHFGVSHILGPKGVLPRLGGGIYRTAEGGAETVQLYYLEKPPETLKRIKKLGYCIYGTDVQNGSSLFSLRAKNKSLFVLGSESKGMSVEIRKICDEFIYIPGTGAVESLNVSAASALLFGQIYQSRSQE